MVWSLVEFVSFRSISWDRAGRRGFFTVVRWKNEANMAVSLSKGLEELDCLADAGKVEGSSCCCAAGSGDCGVCGR